MLPKKNRVDTRAVDGIFKEGKFFNSSHLTFKFIRADNPSDPRISFIAPKMISKRATDRNKLRRRGYAALRKYIDRFPAGLSGVFIFKKYEDDVSIIEDEIKNLLDKIN